MRRHQSGGMLVEYALTFTIFLMFLLGIVDFSRMLFTYSAANEATRAGARYAVVCHDTTDAHDEAVRSRMRGVLPQIDDISIQWTPPACDAATCEGVTVSITGLQFQWITPVVGTLARPNFLMPGFSTYLPREVMRQDPRSDDTLCPLTAPPT